MHVSIVQHSTARHLVRHILMSACEDPRFNIDFFRELWCRLMLAVVLPIWSRFMLDRLRLSLVRQSLSFGLAAALASRLNRSFGFNSFSSCEAEKKDSITPCSHISDEIFIEA